MLYMWCLHVGRHLLDTASFSPKNKLDIMIKGRLDSKGSSPSSLVSGEHSLTPRTAWLHPLLFVLIVFFIVQREK